MFSGSAIIDTAAVSIHQGQSAEYPIIMYTGTKERKGELIVNSFQELVNWLNLNLNFLDRKILEAEIEMIQNDEFDPDLCRSKEVYYTGKH